jgi:gliding-associated putative ABC transporter substrate-binding component GldG
MDFRDKTSYSINTKALTFIVLGILILVNIISLRYFVRFDWTKGDQYSISDSTKDLLQGLDDIVTVKAYFSDDLPPQYISVRQYVKDILSEYKAYSGGNFDYEFVDPAKDLESAQEAQQIGVQQVRMQIRQNDSFQVQNGYLGMGIFYEAKTEAIPIIQEQDAANLEYDLTSLIIKLTQPKLHVVAFLEGHGEHAIGTGVQVQGTPSQAPYSAVGQFLRKNYDVRTVDFSKQQTLTDVDVLVVAGPKRDLTERAIFEIDQFLLRGGKAVFLVDGIRQIENGINLEVLDSNAKTVLSPLGLTVDSNLMLDVLSELANFSEGPGRFYYLQFPPFIRLVADNFSPNPVVSKIQSFVVRFVSSITVTDVQGLTYDRIVHTSPSSWYQDYPFQINPSSIPQPKPENGGSKPFMVSVKGAFPRITTSESIPPLQQWVQISGSQDYELRSVTPDDQRRGRQVAKESTAESQVILFSDSDFITDASLQNDQAALVLFLNAVDSLTLGDTLIGIHSKAVGSPAIRQLDQTQMNLMRYLGIFLVPVLITGYGVIRLWVRRKEEKMLKV